VINFRYRQKGTPVHALNPFAKLAWVASIFVLSLLFNHPVYLLLLFLATLPLIIAARIWRQWVSLMKFTLYLCLAIVIINALVSSHGVHLLWQAPFQLPLVGTPAITLEAIFFGTGMCLRLLAIISAFALLTFTVHPDDIMLAMLKMKLPYKSVLAISLSTRFIPTLIEDAARISDVQRSRGLELDRGRLTQRLKSRMAIIIPLLSNSLDRTVQVAEAMEARAFGSGQKRSFYKEIALKRPDIPALITGLIPLLLGIFIWWRGMGDYQYYPALARLGFTGLEGTLLALLILSLCLMLPLGLARRGTEVD